MNPSVSIIVPVYNAEAALRRCIESILHQTCGDFELLLVDDGSTDSSGAICDEYAAQDTRIRVFHKENGGVSAARNLALDNAQGTYLQFLNSDDWVTPDATRLCLRTAREQNADLVISDFYRVVGDRVSVKGDIEETEVLSQSEYAEHMMANPADFYYCVLWNKLYRRDIVEAHHLRMNEEINWCEDFLFNLEYIRCARRCCALNVPLYYYVKTKGSLASQISLSK
ncbi:MAG: glycosyltransferase, partial [Oscillibacter sp.]|nr:glycosyltransferase [Oscillibacter sp.]